LGGFGGADSAESPGPLAQGGAAGAQAGDALACDPDAEDEPDDVFEDSNCDGTDGDLRRAIFVAPKGDDTGSGTLEEPLASLGIALERAHLEQKDVYVCNGLYEQALVIDHAVRVYGGYDCEGGGSRVTDRARFAPLSGVPLSVHGATGVVLERLAFVAPDNEAIEGSSIAGVIEGSIEVQLRRVELESGRAGPGLAGEQGAPLAGRAPNGEAGGNACLRLMCDDIGEGGYSPLSPACEGGGSAEVGGAGGDGGHDGIPAEPGQPSPSGVAGGMVSVVLAEADGASGRSGAVGAVGAGPLQAIGEIDGTGYLPSNAGLRGAYGRPGQGGGGGAGVQELWEGDLCCAPGHGGSQGGFGGCGGRPGQGGTGGGASIALLIVESDVTLTWSRLVSGSGGKGGPGGLGGLSQEGGPPGAVYSYKGVRLSGVGGAGGRGGAGGSGGPGGGGPSLGIALLAAPQPKLDSVQVLLGSPGFGGDAAADAVASGDGPDGIAASGYDFSTHEPITF